MPVQRKTRKNSHVLNVRSGGAVKSFEKVLGKGPLTLVYVNAKWCGACHRFNDEVWEPLTKLKNRSVNLASVDSEMIGKTSLANVPRSFYPTLMLVGKDKKPATFEDEEGKPTNAMPRNSTLSEDREALSNLVRNPTLKSNVTIGNLSMPKSPYEANSYTESSLSNSMPMANSVPMANSMPMANTMVMPRTVNNTRKSNKRPNTLPNFNSVAGPNTVAESNALAIPNTLKKSVNQTLNQLNPTSLSNPAGRTLTLLKNMGASGSKQVLRSTPPDVDSDLISSQTRSETPTAVEKVRGGMLDAIRNKASSLKAMLKLRQSTRKQRK